jgi:hypothetical protein
VQVVVLDHVRIGGPDPAAQTAQEIRLRRVAAARRLEDVDRAGGPAQRDQEDAIDLGIEAGGLEIQLRAAKIVEAQPAEVGAPGRDQVLFLGRQRQHRALAQLAHRLQRLSQAQPGAVQERAGQRAQVGGAHQVAQVAGAL